MEVSQKATLIPNSGYHSNFQPLVPQGLPEELWRKTMKKNHHTPVLSRFQFIFTSKM